MTSATYLCQAWRGYCDGKTLLVPREQKWILGDKMHGVVRWSGKSGGRYLYMKFVDGSQEWHATEFTCRSDREAQAYAGHLLAMEAGEQLEAFRDHSTEELNLLRENAMQAFSHISA